MAVELTPVAVEKMKPGAARREVPDGRFKGLYLVIQPSGSKSWAFRYRTTEGTPRKLTLGSWPLMDLKSAREEASKAYLAAKDDKDPAAEKTAKRVAAKVPRVAEDRDLVERVADTFIERYAKANTKSWPEAKRILDREVVGPWRGRHLAGIGRADVHELLDAVVDRGSPIMANRVLAALRKMCAWAVERGIIPASPCDKIKAPTAERSRDRVLSDDELRGVWTASGALGWPFRDLVRLLMLTGQRRDEVGSMRWNEVDLDGALWTIPKERAKNGQAHLVPLSAPAVAILRGLPKIDKADLVFTSNGRTAVSGFSKAKERMDLALGEGVPPWVFHDLRRTAATGMARLGVALPTIEKVLNHTSGSFGGIVGVYQRHGFDAEKRHALDAWGAFVERLTGGQGDNVVALAARAS